MNTKDMSKAEVLKRMKLQNPTGKKIRTLTGIKRKLIKINSKENKKKTMHSFMNPNQIDIISYMFSEIWLTNL